MKCKIGKVFLSLLLLLAFGCNPSPKEQLQETGLFGEHELMRPEKSRGFWGSHSGSFFLGTGLVSGSVGTEHRLQFCWSPKPGELVVTELPYSKLRIVIDESKKIPTVEFIYEDIWLNNNTERDYKASKFENLNELISGKEGKYFVLARVRISTSDLEKEIFLPKAR